LASHLDLSSTKIVVLLLLEIYKLLSYLICLLFYMPHTIILLLLPLLLQAAFGYHY